MNEKLNGFHIFILIHMIQVGVGIFALPRVAAEYFGYNGWLMLVVIAAIVAFNIYLMWIVWKMGKGASIFVIFENYLPKWVIYPIYVILAFTWSFTASLVAKQYVLIFQVTAFPTANPMIFMFFITLLAYLLTIKGVYVISKASTVFFFLVMWMIILEVTFYNDLKLSRYTHYLFKEGKEYWLGAFNLFGSYLGFELCLLLFPYVQPKTRFFTSVQLANVFSFLIYLGVTLICFGFYSLQQLKLIMFPFIDLLAYIKFPFIERAENILFSFLLLRVLITIVMYHWAAGLCMQQIFKSRKIEHITLVMMGITYLISFIPSVLDEVGKWLFIATYFNIAYTFVLPLGLIGILSIQRWRKQLA
ncbi:GerAB/ArcD/ProY family transporter [Paenibacillus qinlingensis]|uniref:Spore germination protein (Amino acid permease) n=1 Tax=Paenibacillus qinlingensis TaxID=1837343 RepID=A0ABU1P770_9BACL|nr:GerAB/ArcD/ProY family transporter [Paenibacillus qinlingensis]MDR6555581.1 spore germination protein (amino acid permease) [Paenibacillus qinlingensis]